MAEYLVNSKQDRLLYRANAEGFNKNGLQIAYEFRLRISNKRSENLFSMELKFHRETKQH